MKKYAKPLVMAALTFILALLVWGMFRESWGDIGAAILQSRKALLLVLLLLGLCWYLLDAVIYWMLFREEGTPLPFFACVRAAFLSIFCDVFTMGAGTKPAQVWYCHKKGAALGSCASILTLPYLFQKLLIVCWALAALVAEGSFIRERFGDAVRYIYIGAAGSIVLSAALLLVCVFPPVHAGIDRLLALILRGERWVALRGAVSSQLGVLSQSASAILKAPARAARVALLAFAKLTVLYAIPIVSLLALGGNLFGATVPQVLAMAAVMKLVMGVLPTSGGVGSLELVFALIFKAVFGEITGGAVMVLFRLATYYCPFLLSVFLVGGIVLTRTKASPSH